MKGWPYRDLNSLKSDLIDCGISIPFSDNVTCLGKPLDVGKLHIPNRLAIQPMEGCDGSHEEGTPEELTVRRYMRFAEGGAGLIWFEATAIVREGRANPRQLMISEKNLDAYKRLLDNIREAAMKKFGYAPVIIMQETHSGRYSKPDGFAAPMIAYNNPIFEKEPLSSDRIVTDDYLKRLEEQYGKTAKLAEAAGFDGVDIKACHRYLMCEFLSAYTRDGEYGGSFENRTRLFRNAIASAKSAVSGKTLVTSRMNVFDAYPRPYGWGAETEVTRAEAAEWNGKHLPVKPDLTEPIRLVKQMNEEWGMPLVDFTLGNPYSNPHVNRPYAEGAYTPPESPFEGVARACELAGRIKAAVPGMKIISSAVSYMRQYGAEVAAGMLDGGYADMVGFGRMGFAYPDFAADVLSGKGMNPNKVCLACSKCTELMRSGSTPGCVIRDSGVYMPLYRDNVINNEKDVRHMVSNS